MSKLTDLTLEQATALRLYREYHLGLKRRWKERLRADWLRAAYDLPDLPGKEDVGACLQQIRNALGPSWLQDLKEKEFDAPTVDPKLNGRYYIRSAGQRSYSLFDRQVKNVAGEPVCLYPFGTYEQCIQRKNELLVPVEWTKKDRKAAKAEGWDLFTTDEQELQLQRLGDPEIGEPKFQSEEAAWAHVVQDPTKLHQKALRVLQQQSPAEYECIMNYARRLLEDHTEAASEARFSTEAHSYGDS